MIRVLIVDDHGIVRDGLERMIGASDGLEVAGLAAGGAEAVELHASLAPDVTLMDLEMPGSLDGVAATRTILESDPVARILVLTSFADGARIRAALDAGAAGYVLKDGSADDLRRAIRSVAAGEAPLDPKVSRTLLELTMRPQVNTGMTQRERQVLTLIGQGLPNREIARRLEITERTVKGHLTNIYRAIGVTDRTQAALWAREHDVAGSPDA